MGDALRKFDCSRDVVVEAESIAVRYAHVLDCLQVGPVVFGIFLSHLFVVVPGIADYISSKAFRRA